MELVHNTNFKIRAAEIGFERKVTGVSLIQLMQEASMEHIIKIEATAWDKDFIETTWVLLRKEVNFYSWPGLGAIIEVITYPTGFEKIFAYRDYIIMDQNQNIVATGASTWTLINKNTRKITRVPEKLTGFDASTFRDVLPRCETQLPISDQWHNMRSYLVGLYHLDWNGHVNNVYFSKFIMESEAEKQKDYTPLKMITHYRQECFIDDEITVQFGKENTDKRGRYRIVRNRDGAVLVLAEIEWVKR